MQNEIRQVKQTGLNAVDTAFFQGQGLREEGNDRILIPLSELYQ